MADLRIGKDVIENVLDLIGYREDNISAAIAWCLRESEEFRSRFLRTSVSWKGKLPHLSLIIHQHEEGHGITDLEIFDVDHRAVHLIVEAKRGWKLPDSSQLTKYANRPSFCKSVAPMKAIITLSECSQEYARVHLPANVQNTPVHHVSWNDLVLQAQWAYDRSGTHNKRLLSNLVNYLRRQMSMQDQNSNQVYVVALSTSTLPDWAISWIDIVVKRHRYFHPVGHKWPSSPPNYVGFRYGGKLQAIHHVDKHSIIEDLAKACPEIPSCKLDMPHYLYQLGPPIVPSNDIRTGNIYRNGRVWCALDLLLTSSTIAEARDASKAREDS